MVDLSVVSFRTSYRQDARWTRRSGYSLVRAEFEVGGKKTEQIICGYSGPEAKSLVKSLIKLTDDLTLIDFDSLKFD